MSKGKQGIKMACFFFSCFLMFHQRNISSKKIFQCLSTHQWVIYSTKEKYLYKACHNFFNSPKWTNNLHRVHCQLLLRRYLFEEGQGSTKDVIHGPQFSNYKKVSNRITESITGEKKNRVILRTRRHKERK